MDTKNDIITIYHYSIADLDIITQAVEKHKIDDSFIELIKEENLYPIIRSENGQYFFVITLSVCEENSIRNYEIDCVITPHCVVLYSNCNISIINKLIKDITTTDIADTLQKLVQGFCTHMLDTIKNLETIVYDFQRHGIGNESINEENIESIMKTKMDIGILKSTIVPFIDIVEHITEEIINKLSAEEWSNKNHQINYYIKQIQSQTEFIDTSITTIADTANIIQTMHTNTIMRRLSIISSIFMPLSFVAGLFGMNFTHLPINNSFIYYSTWIFMLFISLFQLYVFKQKKRL